MKGFFISFEGNDGSGKSTQIQLLYDYLINKGYDVLITREPGGTRLGEKIRELILDTENKEMTTITEMMLYAAARAQLVSEVIEPALKQGYIVISDRFVDSSLVYQGIGRQLGIERVMNVNQNAINGVLPDITFFIDLDPEIALNRRKATTKADRLESEKLEFHRMVYMGYKKLVELYPERIKSIDGTLSIENIFVKIKEQCDLRLLKSNL